MRRADEALVRVHQLKALVLWCTEAKKALAFPKNSFSFSSSRTRRRRAVISASISRGSGRPCAAAWRRSRSSLTHRPTTDSPSPKSRATDAIEDPVSNTKDATSRRYSGVKRRRVPITGTSLSAGTRTRLTKCQQHQPKPKVIAPSKGRTAVSFLFHGCGTQMSMPLLNVSFVDHGGRQCDPEEGTGCLRKLATREMATRSLSSVGT